MKPVFLRALAAALTLAALGVATDRLFARETGPFMEQAWANIRFAERPSLVRALEHYPKLWPPLYPLLLREWLGGTHLPARRFNEILFLATLPLLWSAARRVAPEQTPLPLVSFWAVAHFNQIDFYQLTSDALVVPLTLGLYLLLLSYARGPGTSSLTGVALLTALLTCTRYFSLFAVVPVIVVVLWTVPNLPRRRRMNGLVAVGCGLVPLGLWMLYSWHETGYLTGADRRDVRHFPEYLRYLAGLTTAAGDVYCWSKTLFLDFFSTHRTGVLAFVATEYDVYPLEWLMLGLAAVCAGIALVAATRIVRSGAPLSAAAIAALMFLTHTLMLLLVWSLGNNDPLNSRYLWPSYAFLLLLALAAYARVRAAWPSSPWPRLPFHLLWVLLMVVHCQRSVEAVPVPVPFDLEPGSETLDNWLRTR